MQLDSEILDYGIIKVNLSGRLDLLGAQAIDMKFTALTATQNAPFLVDISDVSFNPQPNVLDVLQASGVSSLIPIFHDFQEAMDALTNRQNK
jgi:anti-anti-sigma regulatory factor